MITRCKRTDGRCKKYTVTKISPENPCICRTSQACSGSSRIGHQFSKFPASLMVGLKNLSLLSSSFYPLMSLVSIFASVAPYPLVLRVLRICCPDLQLFSRPHISRLLGLKQRQPIMPNLTTGFKFLRYKFKLNTASVIHLFDMLHK